MGYCKKKECWIPWKKIQFWENYVNGNHYNFELLVIDYYCEEMVFTKVGCFASSAWNDFLLFVCPWEQTGLDSCSHRIGDESGITTISLSGTKDWTHEWHQERQIFYKMLNTGVFSFWNKVCQQESHCSSSSDYARVFFWYTYVILLAGRATPHTWMCICIKRRPQSLWPVQSNPPAKGSNSLHFSSSKNLSNVTKLILLLVNERCNNKSYHNYLL